jgi:hypothetical protein
MAVRGHARADGDLNPAPDVHLVSVSTTSGLDFRIGYDVVEWKLKEERI